MKSLLVRVLRTVTTCAMLVGLSACGGGGSPSQEAPATGQAPAAHPADTTPAPAIASVAPARGFVTGGEAVTLTGSGFTGATAVTFGGLAGTSLVVVDDTHATVVTPAHAGGTVDVQVTAAAGTGTAANAFTYRTSGMVTTVAGGGSGGDGSAADAVQLAAPIQPVYDASGNLVFADYSASRVRVLARAAGTYYGLAMNAGSVYTIAGNGTSALAGDGGPATAAALGAPAGIAIDAAGNVVVADYFNNRIRVVAGSSGTFYGMAMAAGNIYTVAGGGAGVPDGVPGTAAMLRQPVGLATDAAGNVLVAGYMDNRVNVLAASTGAFYGRAMTVGSIYVLAGTGATGFAGDGASASAAVLNWPIAVTSDAAGNVLIADYGNSRVRAIAAQSGTYYGVAMAAGNIYTVAGNGVAAGSGDDGPPLAAGLRSPAGLALDAAGNLAIVQNDGIIRVVAAATGTRYDVAMTAGNIYTVGGGGSTLNDGLAALDAQFRNPFNLTVDADGRLVIGDFGNSRIRAIWP